MPPVSQSPRQRPPFVTPATLARPSPLTLFTPSWDDYHTRAETLRFVQRTRPDAIAISSPELAPGTPWYAAPEHYGFRQAQGDAARRAAGVAVRGSKDKTIDRLANLTARRNFAARRRARRGCL